MMVSLVPLSALAPVVTGAALLGAAPAAVGGAAGEAAGAAA